MSIIRLKDLTYTIKNRTIIQVDELTINEGDVIGIMGPNGAGKSTLVKMLALLEPPTTGDIFIHEEKVDAKKIPLEYRRKFSIALQQSLLLDASVYQNVAIGLKLRKFKKKEIDEQVNYWLDLFQISHLAHKHAAFLSGGEAQRVNLARAMIIRPEVLFLDEPFSALDFPTKLQLLSDLKEIIKEFNMTTVFISHDLTEVKYLTEQMIVIMDGKIAQTGLTKDVIDHPNDTAEEFIKKWRTLVDY